MSNSFTHEHGLIEEITSKELFANPAGRQGYEVIVLENQEDGSTRFYATLKPGETLRLSERLFGTLSVRAVDIRHARSFPVQGEFAARERGRKVTVKANVRYRVIDARIVATEVVDPLAELRDKVVAALNRELSNLPEAEITSAVVEMVIRGVGLVAHLGLQVTDAEVLQFRAGPHIGSTVIAKLENVTGNVVNASVNTGLEAQARQTDNEATRLPNINALLHKHPELAPAFFAAFTYREQAMLDARMSVLSPAIGAYLDRRRRDGGDVEPRDIVRIMAEALQRVSYTGKQTESLRLDVAAPGRVAIHNQFDLAVAVKQNNSQLLKVSWLNNVEPSDFKVRMAADGAPVKLNASIRAQHCRIVGPSFQRFFLYPNSDSPILFFSLIPSVVGKIFIQVLITQSFNTVLGSHRLGVLVHDEMGGAVETSVTSLPIKLFNYVPFDSQLPDLADFINARFSSSEIADLCFGMDIDLDEIPGSQKSEKIRELIRYCQRRDQVDELIDHVIEARPNVYNKFLASFGA